MSKRNTRARKAPKQQQRAPPRPKAPVNAPKPPKPSAPSQPRIKINLNKDGSLDNRTKIARDSAARRNVANKNRKKPYNT